VRTWLLPRSSNRSGRLARCCTSHQPEFWSQQDIKPKASRLSPSCCCLPLEISVHVPPSINKEDVAKEHLKLGGAGEPEQWEG
jgi:hypothetical protein